MTSLLDIGSLAETVSVKGKNIDVYGITPEGFFHLIRSFPEISQLANIKTADAGALIAAAPNSIATVIAIATIDRSAFVTATQWKTEVSKVTAVASGLSLAHQLAIVNAAIRLTFPDGIGPFVAALNDLTSTVGEVNGQVSDMTSSKSSRSGFSTDSAGMRLGPAARSVN